MKKIVQFVVIVSFSFAELACANGSTQPVSLSNLSQSPQHATASERIVNRFLRSHYEPFSLDDNLSEKIFDRYIDRLDPYNDTLLVSDIARFDNKRKLLDDELLSGDLITAFELFNFSQKKRLERYQYAISLLDQPMTFTGDDHFEYDRSKAARPVTNAELDTLWRQRVKFDALSLKLTGKEWPEIKTTLTKRYLRTIENLKRSKSEDVFQLFINTFISLLDPHSAYLTPRSNEQFNVRMSLSMEGIGATLQMVDEYTEIVSFTPGGPAEKSKLLQVGDRIVGVGQNNKPIVDVIGWRLDDVVNLILGPKGSNVRLNILPAGVGKKVKTITLTRAKINLEDQRIKKSIKTINGQKIAVLTVPSFYAGLTDDTKRLLLEISNEQVSGVIVDLRMNFGGRLTEAIDFSGLFIEKGPIVQVRNSNKRVRTDYDLDENIYYAGPLVVLTDRFSVSASEIFAAVMQDYGRALIVGETTYGKGTVQQQSELERFYDQVLHPNWLPMGAILYSNEKFYRISGDSTQLKGVVPDIMLPGSVAITETGEAFSDNALPWDRIDKAKYNQWSNVDRYLASLKKQHEQRIAKDPEFISMKEDIQRFNEDKQKNKTISLNYNQRMQELNQDDAWRLKRINERLRRESKPELTSLDDLPKDYQLPDAYLDETVKIALDLANKINS